MPPEARPSPAREFVIWESGAGDVSCNAPGERWYQEDQEIGEEGG